MRYDAITIDSDIMSGTPVFTGTRVAIQTLFDYIETGERLEDFLEDFPSVSEPLAITVLELAGKLVTSEKILHEDIIR